MISLSFQAYVDAVKKERHYEVVCHCDYDGKSTMVPRDSCTKHKRTSASAGCKARLSGETDSRATVGRNNRTDGPLRRRTCFQISRRAAFCGRAVWATAYRTPARTGLAAPANSDAQRHDFFFPWAPKALPPNAAVIAMFSESITTWDSKRLINERLHSMA